MRRKISLMMKHYFAPILIIFLLMNAGYVLAEEIVKEYKKGLSSKSNYSLTIKKNQISLDAESALLKKILKDIGHRMKIEVVTDIPEEKKVTVKFENLPLKEAIKQLSTNYVYLMDSEKAGGEISKIVVLTRGKGLAYSSREIGTIDKDNYSQKRADGSNGKGKHKSQPFKFVLDPSKHIMPKK